MMVPGDVRLFPLCTQFPPLPEGGAGWSQTGYSIPGGNPSWNARCAAFCEHGAGCPPARLIHSRWGRNCRGNVITPQALLRGVWPGCAMGAVLKALLWKQEVLAGKRNINWWDAHSKILLASTPPGIKVPVERKQGNNSAAPGVTAATREVFIIIIIEMSMGSVSVFDFWGAWCVFSDQTNSRAWHSVLSSDQ